MSLPESEIKCSLSEAYFSALSVSLGWPFLVCNRLFDLQKIDAIVNIEKDFGPAGKNHNFSIQVQLKSTIGGIKWKNGKGRFSLDVPTYNKYKSVKTGWMQLLLILVLPKRYNAERWVTCSQVGQSIKGCMYWVSLSGAKDTANRDSVTITVPKSNRFTQASFDKLITDFAMSGDMVPYED